jgi:hypothetical protein
VQEAHTLAGHMICDWIELDWMQAHAAHSVASEASR